MSGPTCALAALAMGHWYKWLSPVPPCREDGLGCALLPRRCGDLHLLALGRTPYPRRRDWAHPPPTPNDLVHSALGKGCCGREFSFELQERSYEVHWFPNRCQVAAR